GKEVEVPVRSGLDVLRTVDRQSCDIVGPSSSSGVSSRPPEGWLGRFWPRPGLRVSKGVVFSQLKGTFYMRVFKTTMIFGVVGLLLTSGRALAQTPPPQQQPPQQQTPPQKPPATHP